MVDKKHNANFRLVNIELFEVELRPPKQPLPADADFEFDIGGGHQFYPDKKLIIAHTDVTIRLKNRDEKLGRIGTAVFFEVSNWDELISIEDGKVDVPSSFLTVLNSIAYSTTRGMLYMQLRGTYLQNAHLPVIDPANLSQPNKRS